MCNEEWSPYAVLNEPGHVVHLAIGEVREEPWLAAPGLSTIDLSERRCEVDSAA